jgi:hypothetical protein
VFGPPFDSRRVHRIDAFIDLGIVLEALYLNDTPDDRGVLIPFEDARS